MHRKMQQRLGSRFWHFGWSAGRLSGKLERHLVVSCDEWEAETIREWRCEHLVGQQRYSQRDDIYRRLSLQQAARAMASACAARKEGTMVEREI